MSVVAIRNDKSTDKIIPFISDTVRYLAFDFVFVVLNETLCDLGFLGSNRCGATCSDGVPWLLGLSFPTLITINPWIAFELQCTSTDYFERKNIWSPSISDRFWKFRFNRLSLFRNEVFKHRIEFHDLIWFTGVKFTLFGGRFASIIALQRYLNHAPNLIYFTNQCTQFNSSNFNRKLSFRNCGRLFLFWLWER